MFRHSGFIFKELLQGCW